MTNPPDAIVPKIYGKAPVPDGPFESSDSALASAIEDVINRHCRENASNTPDFILGEYLLTCLQAFEVACRARETWYGKHMEPGGQVADEEATNRPHE